MEIYSCVILTIYFIYLNCAIINVMNLQKNMVPKIIIRGMFTNQLVGRISRLNKSARRFNSQARVVGSIGKRCRDWNIFLTRGVGIRVLMVPCVGIIPCRKRGSSSEIPPVCGCRGRSSDRALYAFFSHIFFLSLKLMVEMIAIVELGFSFFFFWWCGGWNLRRNISVSGDVRVYRF